LSASAVALTSVPPAADEDPVTYMTPLHVAARDENNDKVLELLEKGADPCIRERGGRTPYAVAMDKGHIMVFIALWLAILICGIGTQLQKISYASGILLSSCHRDFVWKIDHPTLPAGRHSLCDAVFSV
jgi:hypothetical protein